MEIATPWPINKHGTSWRYAVMYFDWRDEEIVWDAFETIDPFKITVCHHPVAAIGFENIRDMVMHRLAETLPYGKHWDAENMTITIDPCDDPDTLRSVVDEQMENVRFSVFGIALLDLADEAVYRALMGALAHRRERIVGEAPAIEF